MSLYVETDRERNIPILKEGGKLAFDRSWEIKVFGLTLALCDRGVCDGREFWSGEDSSRAWDSERLYRAWLEKIETRLRERRIIEPKELDRRVRDLRARVDEHGAKMGGHAFAGRPTPIYVSKSAKGNRKGDA